MKATSFWANIEKRNPRELDSQNITIKLEITNKKIREKSLNTWKLNKPLLNNSWIKKEVSWEIKYFELNENKI